MTIRHQVLPAGGDGREALRRSGQFWTPDWVADAMARYVLLDGADRVLDPAVGAGAFFRAVRRAATHPVCLFGHEIDPSVLEEARQLGVASDDLQNVALTDFALSPPARSFPAIIANPPYLRHHRITLPAKAELKAFGAALLGKALDGRAGLHVYFLLRALTILAPSGRLAFILPADTCEGKFAGELWNFVTRHFCLDAVITFAPDATPFPQVDTNAMIFLMRNAPPGPDFDAVHCITPWTDDLQAFVQTGAVGDSLTVQKRGVAEALASGFSRAVRDMSVAPGAVLGDFADIVRGIATGDNEFFFLTGAQMRESALPDAFFARAVGRTRDVDAPVLTAGALDELDKRGRPTYLLAPDNRPMDEFPATLRWYLETGVAKGLPSRALISQRTPWYRMERRKVPPFLFAYLGRRNARFIRNDAGALPLTSFLCVYP